MMNQQSTSIAQVRANVIVNDQPFKVGICPVTAQASFDAKWAVLGYWVTIGVNGMLFVDTVNKKVIDGVKRAFPEGEARKGELAHVKARSRIFRGLLTRYLWKNIKVHTIKPTGASQSQPSAEEALHHVVMASILVQAIQGSSRVVNYDDDYTDQEAYDRDLPGGEEDDDGNYDGHGGSGCGSGGHGLDGHYDGPVSIDWGDENEDGGPSDDNLDDCDGEDSEGEESDFVRNLRTTPVLAKQFKDHITVVVGLEGSRRAREVFEIYTDKDRPIRQLKASAGNRMSIEDLREDGWRESTLNDHPDLLRLLADVAS